jgi:hypothetical protein
LDFGFRIADCGLNRWRHEQSCFTVGDDFGCAAGVARDDRLARQRGLDIYQPERLAMRRQTHYVDRVHEVGHVAAKAPQFEPVGNAQLTRRPVEFRPQRPLAEAPELSLRQCAEHEGGRPHKLSIALLRRQVRERADNRRLGACAQLVSDFKRRPRGPHVEWINRVMHYGDALWRNSLFDQLAFDGVGTGDEVALPAMPGSRCKTVYVADRGRPAELLKPAAPPAGGGEM